MYHLDLGVVTEIIGMKLVNYCEIMFIPSDLFVLSVYKFH